MWYNTALFKAAGVAAAQPDQGAEHCRPAAAGYEADGTVQRRDPDLRYGPGLDWTTYLPAHPAPNGHHGPHRPSSARTAARATGRRKMPRRCCSHRRLGQGERRARTRLPRIPIARQPSLRAVGPPCLMEGYWIQGQLLTSGANGGPVKNLGNYVLGPAPVLGSNRVSETYFSQGFVMASTSKVKDAAWKLVEYYFGPRGAAERAQIGWGIPALKSVFGDMPHSWTVGRDLPRHAGGAEVLQGDAVYGIRQPGRHGQCRAGRDWRKSFKGRRA